MVNVCKVLLLENLITTQNNFQSVNLLEEAQRCRNSVLHVYMSSFTELGMNLLFILCFFVAVRVKFCSF